MDQTGSEESKQPAGEGGKPFEPAAEQRAGGELPGQQDSPESARRAFDLLERFSGELEEILQSLERTRGSAAPVEETPPPPERAYRPSSIHFDSSPISTRIDPYALPPVESPSGSSRSAPRFLLEALFLILVAVISARTGLRPLLIATAEAVAFLIVAPIELAIARENRRVERLPAGAPLFPATEIREARASSQATGITLDQVEPLVWQSDRPEADWPLVAYQLPSEAESTEEAPEGATEISSTAPLPEDVPAMPKPRLQDEAEVDLNDTALPMGVEPGLDAVARPEIEAAPEAAPDDLGEDMAEEGEPVRAKRFHPFRHDEMIESEVALEAAEELEIEPEAAEELEAAFEAEPEAVDEESKPELGHRFLHAFKHEEIAPENEITSEDVEDQAVEPEVEVEPEAEPEVEVKSPEATAGGGAPERPRHILHPSRHEEAAPEDEMAPEEVDVQEDEPERHGLSHLFGRAGKSSAAEPEAEPEIFAAEAEPEQPHFFHLFRREEEALEAETQHAAGAERAAELEAEAEPELEVPVEPMAKESGREHSRLFYLFFERDEAPAEPEAESNAEPEIIIPDALAAEIEPEQPRRFNLFRHEEKVLDTEPEPEGELAATLESFSAAIPEGPEATRPGRLHLLRRGASEPETEPDAETRIPDGSLDGAPRPSPFEDLEPAPEIAQATAEIELPPEIAVSAIERTLEDLGQREPGLRRRRWPLGAAGDRDVAAAQAMESEKADGESELRYEAERERRRREREYLRNLRASR